MQCLRPSRSVLAAALALAATGALAQPLPQSTITMIGGNTGQPSWRNVEVPFWSKQLPDASGGRVTIQITPWNEMGLKGGEVFAMLRRGVAPIGNLLLAYNTGEVKINDGIDLALLSPTMDDAMKVVAAYRPVFQRTYEQEYGLTMLALWPLPPQIMYCRSELKSLADLKGRKVRVSNASQGHFVQHFGGNDVYIAFGEMQTALQTGVVDCGLTSGTAGYKTGWHEAAKFLYPMPINWQFVGYFANLRAWNGLDPRVREFLAGQFKTLEGKMLEAHREEMNIGVACLTGKGACPEGKPGNMTLIEVTEADKAARKVALEQTILPQWAKSCGAACAREWNQTVGALVGVTAPSQ